MGSKFIEDVGYDRKGQGILIHSLTDAAGMPLLDAIHLRTGKRGRRRKRPMEDGSLMASPAYHA